tara:strand:- start:837 stop:1379 length:543 start_codon:yes stop_codon:yes gene_type:complete
MSGGMGGGEGGVAEDLLTTKGDTHGYTTENARVAIGADTQVLTADSTEALGLKWAAIPTASNPSLSFVVACSDETTDLTTGQKTIFRMPYGFVLTAVRASVTTAPTGSGMIIDIEQNGTSILSTDITIDAGETSSTQAATAPVISTATLIDTAQISFDIDQIGSTNSGQGLKVYLIGSKS